MSLSPETLPAHSATTGSPPVVGARATQRQLPAKRTTTIRTPNHRTIEPRHKMIPHEIVKKIRRIQIRTSHLVDDVLAGEYLSAFKGRGIEFEEVRPYIVGDDVRSIDWNVTARYNQPYVKLFREERELTVVLLVDISRSAEWGTHYQTKRELIAEVASTLAFSAIRNNDKVALILFSDGIEKFVPPRKGSRHVLRCIRELLYCQPVGSGTDIAAALSYLDHTIKLLDSIGQQRSERPTTGPLKPNTK